MNINTNLFNFKKKHKSKKNQIIFHKANCKNNKTIENIINNFLIKKNSFITFAVSFVKYYLIFFTFMSFFKIK